MRVFFVFLFCSLSTLTFGHDAQVAVFTFSCADVGTKMRATFDQEDMLHIWPNYETLDSSTQENLIKEYLRTQTKCYFNYIPQDVCELTILRHDEHVSLEGIIYFEVDRIETVSFRNTCLIDEISGHINIVNFDFSDPNRSFRMDENRKSIQVN